MTDGVVQSAPPAELAPTPEPAEPAPPAESSPTPVESAPIVEQVAPVEPASVISEESQSAPESIAEPPEVVVNVPESNPATQSTSASPQQQTPAAQSSQVPSTKWSAANRAHAVAKRQGKKEARLAKVVQLSKEKGWITNDDIEKLLHVSDATASRYGTMLVKQELLKREGKGRGTRLIYVDSI